MAEIEHTETARVRRAPKVIVFLVLGAAVGVFVAMILTFAFSADTSAVTGVTYSASTVFGFLAIICGAVGLLLGGLVAVILDRRSSRRSHIVTIEREEYLGETDDFDS
ncbi:MAG TPA: potassium transporter Trk [Microbacterium sp.]|uniref:potassium transporter Trk n=1 Tax=Microbacterium sp. TaxID=51671 RepID=UPI002B470F55|nr:potassium transporter Trk [Microbacterium sp.]HKT56734.1 potassium transporter Trk [Microbacterium sp.]